MLVVDDGSTDGTESEARAAGVEVVRHSVNQGKGAAIKTGLRNLAARPAIEYILVLDGDGQHSPEEIPRFLEAANRSKAPMLVGNRMEDIEKMPFVRKLTNRFMSGQISRVCGQKIPDTQCGFRMIHRDLAPALAAIETTKFDYETEMLVVASRRGCAIEAVPISTIYGDEISKIHPVARYHPLCSDDAALSAGERERRKGGAKVGLVRPVRPVGLRQRSPSTASAAGVARRRWRERRRRELLLQLGNHLADQRLSLLDHLLANLLFDFSPLFPVAFHELLAAFRIEFQARFFEGRFDFLRHKFFPKLFPILKRLFFLGRQIRPAQEVLLKALALFGRQCIQSFSHVLKSRGIDALLMLPRRWRGTWRCRAGVRVSRSGRLPNSRALEKSPEPLSREEPAPERESILEPYGVLLGIQQFIQMADHLIVRTRGKLLSKQNDLFRLRRGARNQRKRGDHRHAGGYRGNRPMRAQPAHHARLFLRGFPNGSENIAREKRRN